MIKKIVLILLVIAFIICSVLLAKELFTNPTTLPTPAVSNDSADNATGLANPASVYCKEQGGTVSIRKDASGGEYGVCVFNDGSECDEWKFFRKECSKGTPVVDAPVVDINTDTELIKLALVEKDGIDLTKVNVIITEDTGKYASGGIKPKEEDVGGAYFFAAKVLNGWKIVASGNGTISCESLKPYPDFPTNMIPECVDPVTGNPVQR